MQGVQCQNCKNYLSDGVCSAFPGGIPVEILTGEKNHDQPLPEQENDIVFEGIDEEV